MEINLHIKTDENIKTSRNFKDFLEMVLEEFPCGVSCKGTVVNYKGCDGKKHNAEYSLTVK